MEGAFFYLLGIATGFLLCAAWIGGSLPHPAHTWWQLGRLAWRMRWHAGLRVGRARGWWERVKRMNERASVRPLRSSTGRRNPHLVPGERGDG